MQTEAKPSILALVNKDEMRKSLMKITGMTESERKRYAAKIMECYADPLREVGFDVDSFGYRVSELILATIQHAVFDKHA